MAQLTLSQRSELQNNNRFRQRLAAAATKTAKFWVDFSVDQFSAYNVANQKRKEFARKILSNGLTTINSYAGTFLSTYNEDIADANILENDQVAFNAETNQLTDAQLTDSSASSYTFDNAAGIETGDTTKQINL